MSVKCLGVAAVLLIAAFYVWKKYRGKVLK